MTQVMLTFERLSLHLSSLSYATDGNLQQLLKDMSLSLSDAHSDNQMLAKTSLQKSEALDKAQSVILKLQHEVR